MEMMLSQHSSTASLFAGPRPHTRRKGSGGIAPTPPANFRWGFARPAGQVRLGRGESRGGLVTHACAFRLSGPGQRLLPFGGLYRRLRLTYSGIHFMVLPRAEGCEPLPTRPWLLRPFRDPSVQIVVLRSRNRVSDFNAAFLCSPTTNPGKVLLRPRLSFRRFPCLERYRFELGSEGRALWGHDPFRSTVTTGFCRQMLGIPRLAAIELRLCRRRLLSAGYVECAEGCSSHTVAIDGPLVICPDSLSK